MKTQTFKIAAVLFCAAAVLASCQEYGGNPEGPEGSSFESSDPYMDRNNYPPSEYEDAGTVDAPMDISAEAPDPDPDDPEREIEEADIIKIDGNKLYALSAYRGLVVIDIADPDDLAILGRYPLYGSPFEMYFREDVAYVIFSSFYSYEYDEETNESEWRSGSKLVALDVSDPMGIEVIRTFDLVGQISDSRIVGDILYLVAFENGWCWGCESDVATTITSIFVGEPETIHLVDRLSYEEDGYGGWRRSIAVTQQRMYVSGLNYSDNTSTIQVVDISDPTGSLRQGASIPLEGTIESRWQMDEYDGVLRVISQRGSWGSPPVVETFEVRSSDEIVRLGSMDMVLPRPEDLRSVRFDGTKAYAVTFQRTDPLFTIDLSDPANPRQMGELEIPGWLYHMQPMGDRLVALGFDEDNSLAISLFDVSKISDPVMLDRVSFGASWGWMPEDQDRIHKAFNIIPERNLILMPFSGWGYADGGYTDYRFRSGIQIVTMEDDALRLRATAPHHGYARRAVLIEDRMLAISDERIDTFDITDLDDPELKASLVLARNVYRMAVLDDHVVEVSGDWWTEQGRLDVVSIDDPDNPRTEGSVEIASVVEDGGYGYYSWSSFYYGSSILMAHDDNVYLLWSEDGETAVATFDVSDPADPLFTTKQRFGFRFPYQRGFWSSGTVESGKDIVQAGPVIAMVVNDSRYRYYDDEDPDSRIELLDLSDPANPRHSATIKFPGGFRIGSLQVDGSMIVTSHYESVSDDGRVRFYLDRIDVSDPASPEILPKVNVPGSVVHFDRSRGRIVTVDYQVVSYDVESRDCRDLGYDHDYDYEEGICYVTERSLNVLALSGDRAVRLKKMEFDGWLRDVRVTDTRIFLGLASGYYWYGGGEEDPRPELLVIPLDGDGEIEVASSIRMTSPYTWLTHGMDDRAIVVSDTPPAISIYDTSDSGSVRLEKEVLLTGYAYDIHYLDDMILTANSKWGVQRIDL